MIDYLGWWDLKVVRNIAQSAKCTTNRQNQARTAKGVQLKTWKLAKMENSLKYYWPFYVHNDISIKPSRMCSIITTIAKVHTYNYLVITIMTSLLLIVMDGYSKSQCFSYHTIPFSILSDIDRCFQYQY